jgi:hypothetical protein
MGSESDSSIKTSTKQSTIRRAGTKIVNRLRRRTRRRRRRSSLELHNDINGINRKDGGKHDISSNIISVDSYESSVSVSTDQPSLSFDRPLEQTKRGVDNTIFPTPSSTLSLVEEIEQPSTTATTLFDSSYSVLRNKYMESPGSIRPRLRRGESERAHRHNNFHSYDHRYSTTALSRLVKDAVPFMKGSS